MCVLGRGILCITQSRISLWSTIGKTTLVKEYINYIIDNSFLNSASVWPLCTNSSSPCKYEVKHVGEFRSWLGGSWRVGLVCPWLLWILIRLSALIAHQPSLSSGILHAPVSSCAFAVGRKEKPGFRNEAVGPQINWRKRDNISMHQKGEWMPGRIKEKKKRTKKNLSRGANTLSHKLNCFWQQTTNHLIMFKQRGIRVILTSPEIPWAPDSPQLLSSVLFSGMTKGGVHLCPACRSFRTRKQALQHSHLWGNLTC